MSATTVRTNRQHSIAHLDECFRGHVRIHTLQAFLDCFDRFSRFEESGEFDEIRTADKAAFRVDGIKDVFGYIDFKDGSDKPDEKAMLRELHEALDRLWNQGRVLEKVEMVAVPESLLEDVRNMIKESNS